MGRGEKRIELRGDNKEKVRVKNDYKKGKKEKKEEKEGSECLDKRELKEEAVRK